MIELSHVSKSYKIQKKTGWFRSETQMKCAVKDVSLSIGRGEIVGYIGPNGSGKSTTIKMMAGILLPDEGTIRVNGVDPFYQRKQNGRNIGVLFGQRSQLWWHLKLEDTLNLLRHMYDIPDAQYAARLSMLRKTLSLDEFWGQPIRQLSLGQRMRGELAAALIHNPSILYLDEPTIGMDVIVKESIRDLLKLIHQRDGVTILLTTHDLEDVERICSRVVVINHGQLCFDGSMARLREQCASDSTVTILFASETPVLPDQLRNVKKEGKRVTFTINRAMGESPLLAETISRNIVRDIAISEPPVENVIRDLYEGVGQ